MTRVLAFNLGVVVVCLLALTVPEFAAMATAAGGVVEPRPGLFGRLLSFVPWFLLGLGLTFGWFFATSQRSS